MNVKLRLAGVLAVLIVALALMPAVAMAAPTITQGVNGTVLDSTTGVGIPFASLIIQVDGGSWVEVTAEYDGTYSLATTVSADVRISASDAFHQSELVGPIAVTKNTVTTQNFSLDRSEAFEQPVYRFFNMQAGVHFYTASDQEFINTYKNLQGVFHYDGIAYYVPWGASEIPGLENPNTFPLYRFYNKKTGTHFFTMSEQEKANVIATRGDDLVFEGVAYWVSDRALQMNFAGPGGIGDGFPVHRFYRPSTDSHFFTADSGEIFGPFLKLSDVYAYEGVGFYINGWQLTAQGK